MGLDFRNAASKIWDQLNPLDGGRSYQNPNSSGPVGWSRVRDVFDANSAQDQANRNRDMGVPYRQNMSYADEQKAKGIGRVSNNVWERTTNAGRSFRDSVVEPYNYLSTGLAESAAYDTNDQQKAREATANLQATQQQGIIKAIKTLKNPNLDPASRARWQRYLDSTQSEQSNTFQDQRKRNQEIINRTDPVKGAASVGSIGFDVVTLGLGTGGAQAVKQAGKVATKEVGEQAAKELFKKGMSDVEKEAAIKIAQASAKQAAKKATIKTLAKEGLITGGTNLPGGLLSPYISKGKDATWQDVASSGATAFATGAVLPTASHFAGKVIYKGKNEVAGLLNDVADKKAVKKINDNLEGTGINPITLDGYQRAKVLNAEKAKVKTPTPDVVPIEPVATPVVPGTVQTGRTQGLGDLMPNIGERRNIPTPAEEIVAKYGGKVEDVQRNIDRHGQEATQIMYARKSDSQPFNPETNQGIKNLDAVVTAELNKQNPAKAKVFPGKMSPEEEASLFASAPPVPGEVPQVDNATLVGEKKLNTTDITPQRPADVNAVTGEKQSLTQQIINLPDHATATHEDLPAVKSFSENFDNGLQQLKESIPSENIIKMQQEIAQFHRDGTPISPESVELYDKVFRKPMEAMLQGSKTEIKARDFYFPEGRGRTTDNPIDVGYGFVDKMNQQYGHSMERKGVIPIEQLDDPINLVKDYKEQWLYDKYGTQIEAQHYADAGYSNPTTYVQGQENISKRLADKVDNEIVSVDGEKTKNFNITEDLHKNYLDNGGGDTFTVDAELPKATRPRTERNLLRHLGLYEESGMQRFENAEGVATQIFEDDLEKNIADMSPNQLTETMQSLFGGQLADKQIEGKVIDAAARSVHKANGDRLAQIGILQKLEKQLAGESVRDYAERAQFTDPRVQKVFNQNVEHVLADSRRSYNLTDKIVKNITEMFHLGYLGLKPFSAAQNLTETSRTFGLTGTKNALSSYGDILTGKVKIKDTLARYGQDNRYFDLLGNMPDQYKQTKGDKFKNGIMYLFQKSEEFKDAHMLNALERESNTLGKTGREQAEWIMNRYNDHAIKYGNFGSLHGAKKGPLERSAWQFTQYPLKDWGITLHYMKDAVTGTSVEQKAAVKYLTQTGGAKLVMMAPMYAVFGAGITSLFNLNAPKGGPMLTVPASIIGAINDENQLANSEDRDFNWANVWVQGAQKNVIPGAIPGGAYLLNTLGVQEYIPGLKEGGKYEKALKHDTAIGDIKRGYNENKLGKARFVTPDNAVGKVKMVLGGAYNTPQASEYFGSSPFDVQLPTTTVPFTDTNPNKPGNQNWTSPQIGFTPNKEGLYTNHSPLNDRYQEKLDANPTKDNAKALIQQARVSQDRNKEFYNSDAGKAWKNQSNVIYNPDTKKYESDLISPEKWTAVKSDKSGETFKKFTKDAYQRNKDFGDPIDPLYSDKWSRYKTEILNMRSQFTGDDKEMKDIANATQPWYKDYMKDYISFIDEQKGRTFKEDDKYGQSARAKDYFDLTVANPAIPDNTAKNYPIISKYYDIKDKNPDAAKNFFKANADELSGAFDAQTKDKFEWTNKMRALEGAAPMAWDVFQNITFGYEADESAVYKQLGYKLGAFSKGGGSYDPFANSEKFNVNTRMNDVSIPKVSVKEGSVPKVKTVKSTKYKVKVKKQRI